MKIREKKSHAKISEFTVSGQWKRACVIVAVPVNVVVVVVAAAAASSSAAAAATAAAAAAFE